MGRLAVENYVVFGITLAVITASCQILFLPFLFSEIDAIRTEFDVEIREAMRSFEDSYENLAGIRPSGIRKQREAVKSMALDSDTTGPADHRAPHAEATKTHQARLSGSAGLPPGTSLFSPELRKLAKEEPTPTDDYDDESEYDDSETISEDPMITSKPLRETTVILGPAPLPKTLHSGAMETSSKTNRMAVASPPGPPPICPLEENRCPSGPPGPPGLRGVPGQMGLDGTDGTPGSDAMDELTPSFPTFCHTCPQGPDGKVGFPGITGKPGLVGAPGIPGPTGKNGQPGSPGGYGSPGKQGSMGTRGSQGNPGQDGIVLLNTKGPKGPNGKVGIEGQPGEDGTNNNNPGPIGEPGMPGDVGVAGAPGLYGKRGDIGNVGLKGEASESCSCEALMKKSIENAQNSAYSAVAAMASAPTIQANPEASEIRRTPQKASALAASGLPTLEELRNNYQKNLLTFAQEDEAVVQKFAVAPSDVAISEDTVVGTVSGNSEISEVSDGEEEEEIDTLDEPAMDDSNSERVIDGGPQSKRPSLFAPPRAQLPTVLHESSAPLAITPPKLHAVKTSKKPIGESRQKPQIYDGDTKKIRGEGKSSGTRRKAPRHPAFRVFSTTDQETAFNMDEGEKSTFAEKEIARESEKKIVNLKEIRKSPKKLRRKNKRTKLEKKLRRVHLTPSKKLAFQQRQNSNILENIAESLGLLENQKSSKMNRIPIP